ncbi:MAG: VOC family protein [Anaerolineae bacterium]|nr:VOC family protein [Anaerolineae bacterium]MCI0608102.1 VOC family protein [Anaerolineae bacterium]
MTTPTMFSAIPVLLSLDVPATVNFYTTMLGFTCPYQDSGFAILQRDSVYLHFTGCSEQHLVDWSSCRVAVDGVDALYEQCSSQGIVHPNSKLEDTDYGTREFGIVDIHGVLITFFERKSQAA